MRKTITLFLLTCLFITGINLTTFGSPQKQLTKHLVEQMELVSENDFIKINITLKNQYDSQALIATAKTMGMAERREYVINVLKDFSELSQKGVIADLNQMQQNQTVKEVMTFWIANVVNCKATPAAIEQLALRNDIASIDYDEKRILIDLKTLSGNVHEVITGVSLRTKNKMTSFHSITKVFFKELSTEEIDYYVSKYKPFDKAGAYGIQEWIGHIGIEKIEGSYFNVVGLPVQKLYVELLQFADNK